jgi:hypothetical protein
MDGRMTRALLALCALLLACRPQKDAPPRVTFVPEPKLHGSVNIQRTMRLLATSTAAHPNRVRILFYGQSITQSGWSRTVAHELVRRYPHARIEVENRAIGGFSSEYLVKSAESDVYPYYPDLIIFHVYGSHYAYEDIIRKFRERTTAEILLQNDHVVDDGELEEESDPSLLEPKGNLFIPFMNHAFFPKIAARYDAALCDQRSAWKRFLEQRKLPAAALLVDHVHLNAAGDQLMAELVLRCLRPEPELGPSPIERSIKSLQIEPHQWQGGTLRVPFRGNRVDARVTSRGVVRVRIDGKKPSDFRELYSFTRVRANGAPWPPLYDLESEAVPLIEDWTLRVDREPGASSFRFELIGEKSGPDGRGESSSRFVSRSRRVVIDPDDWNVEYAFELAGARAVPPHFSASFAVEHHGTDMFQGEEGEEHTVVLAQGLPQGEHLLELEAAPGATPVSELQIYRPPGDETLPRAFVVEPPP